MVSSADYNLTTTIGESQSTMNAKTQVNECFHYLGTITTDMSINLQHCSARLQSKIPFSGDDHGICGSDNNISP